MRCGAAAMPRTLQWTSHVSASERATDGSLQPQSAHARRARRVAARPAALHCIRSSRDANSRVAASRWSELPPRRIRMDHDSASATPRRTAPLSEESHRIDAVGITHVSRPTVTGATRPDPSRSGCGPASDGSYTSFSAGCSPT
jgi:hypothetical protein